MAKRKTRKKLAVKSVAKQMRDKLFEAAGIQTQKQKENDPLYNPEAKKIYYKFRKDEDEENGKKT